MNKNLNVLIAPCAYVLNDNRTESLGTMSYYILRELGKLGVQTTTLTMKAEIKEPIPNCRIIELMPGQPITKIGLLKFLPRYYQKSKQLLKTEKFDLVHHMFPFGFEVGFNPLITQNKLKGLPFILGPVLAPHTTEINLSDERNITKSYGNQPKKLSLSERAGSLIFDNLVGVGKKQAFKWFQKTLNQADWVVAGDEHTKRCFSKYVDDKKLSVLRIGIDLEVYHPLEVKGERLKVKGDKVEILTVGYLTARKGIEYLIEGFAKIASKYPEAYIKVIGDGPSREKLESLAGELKIKDRVQFIGSLKYYEVVPHYQNCDIFCLPALSETWVVAQEAMACAKPVILTNTGSHPEHVPDGQVGYLVPLKHSDAVAEALEKLLQDPAKRREMGQNARQHIEENYDWAKIAQGYLELYEKLIKRSSNTLP